MKKINLILLFVISFLALFSSCAAGQYIKNPEKELKAEKIYVKSNGEKVDYKIKITNISNQQLFLIIKAITPFSPDGKICEYSKENKFVHVIYTIYKIPVNFNPKEKLGSSYLKLEKNEAYFYLGTIESNKCKFQADRYAPDYLAGNFPNNDNGENSVYFVLSLNYSHNFKCKNVMDCNRMKSKKEFTLWEQDTLESQIFDEGVVYSRFLFKFDESESN